METANGHIICALHDFIPTLAIVLPILVLTYYVCITEPVELLITATSYPYMGIVNVGHKKIIPVMVILPTLIG